MSEAGQLPWIDEEAIARRYPTLFHYTRLSSLGPILASDGMRATHFAHTNDAEEFYGLRSLFPKLMSKPALALAKRLRAKGAFKRSPSNEALARIVAEDAASFHDAMVRALPLPFHVTCFSKHSLPHHEVNGLLTLWRFYGGDGEGVALGFNTSKLIECTHTILKSFAVGAVYLDEVRYGADDPVLLARLADAPGLTEMYLEFIENLVVGRELDFGARATEMYQFTVLAACAKHPDFVDEREVRLVTTPAFPGREDGRSPCVEQDNRFMLLPYMEALDCILVGPSQEQPKALYEVETALSRSALKGISVIPSRTPFRFVRR